MEIYIEYVIFNNLAINYLVLFLSLKICKRKTKWFKIVISASVGAVYAVISPFFEFKGDFIFKIALALIMCIIVSSWNYKKIFSLFMVFLLVTFTLGGAIIGISNLFFPVKAFLFSQNTYNIGIISILCLTSIYLTKMLIAKINSVRVIKKNTQSVLISLNKQIINENGYYDSGNLLYYNSIYPIIVLDESFNLNFKPSGKTTVQTVNGNSVQAVYKVNNLIVNGHNFENVYCIFKKLHSKYKIILHNDTV